MLLQAQKSMIDGPRFLLMALYPRVCLNATLLQHILQSLQDFEVALNTYSSPVVPKLKSYFTIEGEFFKLLVKNPMQQLFLIKDFYNFHYWHYHYLTYLYLKT